MKPYLNVTDEVRKKVDEYYSKNVRVFGDHWLNEVLKDDNPGRLLSWWHVRKTSRILGESGSTAVETGARTCVKFFYNRSEAANMRYLSLLPPTRGILRVYDVVYLPANDRYAARMDRILCTRDQAFRVGISDHCQQNINGIDAFDFIAQAVDSIGMCVDDTLGDWHGGNWGYSFDGYPTWIDWEEGSIPKEHRAHAHNIPIWDGKKIVRPEVKEKAA